MTTHPTTKDPVCGMDVSPVATRQSNYDGVTYYFCSESCLHKFEDDPVGVLAALVEKRGAENSHVAGQDHCHGGNQFGSQHMIPALLRRQGDDQLKHEGSAS